MTKDQIVIGRTYRGKSGGLRKVLGRGEKSWANQTDTDVIAYQGERKGVLGPRKSMTRASFASWAIEEVPS